MRTSLQLVLLVACMVLLASPTSRCYSQGVRTLPNGEPVISSDGAEDIFGEGVAEASIHHIYFSTGYPPVATEIFETTDIIKSIEGKTNRPYQIIVTFTTGRVILLDLLYDPPKAIDSVYVVNVLSQSWEDAIGDAIYILSTSFVYVTRDSGRTVQVDSAGLSGQVWSIAIDSAQYVYAATSAGLYRQHPDSNVWHQVTSFTLNNNLRKVYIDRRNRIFLGGNGGGTYLSTDNGGTWSFDTSGIGLYTGTVLGDDAFGNIYYAAGGGLYTSIGGTQPWTRSDPALTTLVGGPLTIRSISGDSALFVGTSFGMYVSTDQGQSWTDANKGIKAETFTGFGRMHSGKTFLSTGLGIFSNNPNDTSWQKVYPANGYQAGAPIYQDGIGNIYTSARNPTNPNGADLIFKSTDGGSTWVADTVGAWRMGFGKYFFDENGTQHAATIQWGGSFLSMVYTKNSGSSWTPDTSGFPVFNYSYSSAIASNKHGLLYISGSYTHGATTYPQVFRRPIGGGAWTADTAGLPSSVPSFNWLFPDKNGNMLGLTGSQLYHQEGGVWVKKTLPNGVTFANKMSIDSSGALYVVRVQYIFPTGNTDVGISLSTDNGTTWSNLTHDTIKVQVLSSFGDTTYAVTSKGVLVLTTNGVTAVDEAAPVPQSYRLEQNYPNPFNPSTILSYRLPVRSEVTLEIYNVLGQALSMIVHEVESAGEKQVVWNAGRFASGIYYYRLEAVSVDDPSRVFRQVRKMVLVK